MYEYLSDTITHMRQAISLVGSRDYKIPVLCIITYSLSDVYSLRSVGKLNNNFSIQDIAEEYFGGIIDDITIELGADDVKNFNFIVKSYVDEEVESSSMAMLIDTKGTMKLKSNDMAKRAKIDAMNHTQQQYLEDMISRGAKKYLNR